MPKIRLADRSFGDPDVTILPDLGKPNRPARNRSQHLLAGRCFGRTIIKQICAMNPTCGLACAIANDRNEPWPSSTRLEIGEVGMELEIFAGRIVQATAHKIGLARSARHGLASGEDAGNLKGVVRFGRRWRPRGQRPAHSGKSCCLLEECAVGETRRMVDEVDRACTFTRRVIISPARPRALEMDDTRAFLARRTAQQVGASKRLAIRG
jgi:hypothetical protein